MGIKDMAISFLPTKSTATTVDTDNVFKTLNSVYFDSANEEEDHVHDDDDDEEEEEEDIESIVRGAHSESRLFFDPSTAKSIAIDEDQAMMNKYSPFKESVAMAMESEDPYMDFRVSMEEMVESHGQIKKDWGCLEELLAWYLRVNGKNNHAYIVAAFVDLLLKISSSPPNSDDLHQNGNEGCSSNSSTSTRSSSCVSGELQQMGFKSSSCFSPSASSSLSSDHHHHHQPPREEIVQILS